jgi:hypothetical protein
VVLWLLGLVGGVGGSLIHHSVVLALGVIVVNLLSGRRALEWARPKLQADSPSGWTPAALGSMNHQPDGCPGGAREIALPIISTNDEGWTVAPATLALTQFHLTGVNHAKSF